MLAHPHFKAITKNSLINNNYSLSFTKTSESFVHQTCTVSIHTCIYNTIFESHFLGSKSGCHGNMHYITIKEPLSFTSSKWHSKECFNYYIMCIHNCCTHVLKELFRLKFSRLNIAPESEIR